MYHSLLITHPIAPTPEMRGAATEQLTPPEMLGDAQYSLLHALASDPAIVGYERPGYKATQSERDEWQQTYDRVRLAATYLLEEQDALSWDAAVAVLEDGGSLLEADPNRRQGEHETQVTEAFDAAIRETGIFNRAVSRLGVGVVALASRHGAKKALLNLEEAGHDVFGVRHMRGVPEEDIIFEGAKRPVIDRLDTVAAQYETELYGPVIQQVRQKAVAISDKQLAWERKHGTLEREATYEHAFSRRTDGLDLGPGFLKDMASYVRMPIRRLNALLNGTMADAERQEWNAKLEVKIFNTACRYARRALRNEDGAEISGDELVRRMGFPEGTDGPVISKLVASSMLKRSADGSHFSALPNLRARRFNLFTLAGEIGTAMLRDAKRMRDAA